MLKKLFRPKWQHENPQVRKTAIEKLHSKEISTLTQLALHDTDNSVRQLAIEKIDDLQTLEHIISSTQSTADHAHAIKCWALKLLNNDALSLAYIEQYIINCTNETLLVGIITYCENDKMCELALSGITNEKQLLSLMNHTKSGYVWQTIIQKLQTEEAFKTAQHIVKGRDKKSLQLIKKQLDDIKSAKNSLQEKERQAQHILEKLESLLKNEYTPLFEGILITVKKQWLELSSNFTSIHKITINEKIATCEKQLEQSKQEKTTQEAMTQQISHDSNARKQLLQQLTSLKEEAITQSIDTEFLQQQLNTINTQWHNIELAAQPKNEILFKNTKSIILKVIEANNLLHNNNLFSELSEANSKNLNYNKLESATIQLRATIKQLQWPDSEIKPDCILKIERHLQWVLDKKQLLNDKTKNSINDIKQWLIDIDLLIEQNDLATALKQQKKIRTAISQLPDKDATQFNINFQRINQAIHALEDWKDYATDPKRTALTEEMQKLITANIPPESKAENIKKIQQEWKALGPCHNQQLWQQFKDYADEAYIPCQQYFDQQKQLREFNAAQRTIICEQLETFISQQTWQDCDWKAIEKLHKAIQDEWKKFSPVERHIHKPLQDRYFKNISLFKEKLNDERIKNNNLLRELVDKAIQLQHKENIHDAIEQYQKIHEQWKLVGISFRKEQQQHWEALKAAGDALYETRQNQRQDADSERLQKIDVANQLCANILKLSQLDDTELSNSRTTYKELCDTFKTLEELPKECMQLYQKACHTYEDAIKNIGNRLWIKQFAALEKIAAEWLQVELVAQAPLFNSIPEMPNEIPEKWRQTLQQRFTSSISHDAEKNARMLCIELEILCDANTPAEDSSLKMQMQMSKLAESFGSQQQIPFNDKLEELYLRWFSQPCWNKDAYQQLTSRFLATAKNALQKKVAT